MKTARDPSSHARSLQCMEILGGAGAREELFSTPGLDAWLFSRPYHGESQGGDVHYLSLCGGGVITRFVLADVSGHGQAVAEFSAALRRIVRKNINRKSQGHLVAALNREFSAMAELRRFATAVVATYLATKRTLTVCNAGHPRPLLYRAESREWSILGADSGAARGANLPLGIDDASDYESFAVDLKPNDVVIAFTDAMVEAQDEGSNLLGEAGLLDLARGLDPTDPSTIGPALVSAVEGYRRGETADDDLTVLVLRHTAQGPKRLSVGEKLDVYAKVFGLKAV